MIIKQKCYDLLWLEHTFCCHLLHPALIHPSADEQYHFLCCSVHCLSHLTGLKGAGQVEVFRVAVSRDVFIGLSRWLPSASALLWWPSCISGSGLTIVASSSGRQKPSQLQKRVSSVTERCKTGNAVKFTAFTRCEGNYCLSGSGGKDQLGMSQVWEIFRVQQVRIVWKYQITI